MAKKKNLKLYVPGIIALVLGIAAFCMMFLDAVKYSADAVVTKVSYEYSGSQLAFGYTEGSIEILSFNFMIFISFLLPIIGGVLCLLGGDSFILKIVSTACFVVGAVFLFAIGGFASIGMSDAQAAIVEKLETSLCAGPIIAAILSILGAVVCFFKKTIAKRFK